MTEFFDDLESRDPGRREADLMDTLSRQVAHAQQNAPAFTGILDGVEAGQVNSRQALAGLPVTRKSELVERQRAARPFGGLVTSRPPRVGRIFASPGPIYEPEARTEDYWRFGRALFAAGFREGDIIHNCFSYHMTPAGSMVDSGAHALGCAVVPAGVGQTDLQVRLMADIRPQGYVGTPSFLKIILEKAEELKEDLGSLSKALVSGEALPGSLRGWFSESGIEVAQCYATADLGLIAYETSAREGLVVDEGVILEIVRPGSGDPLPEGEVGEVVVTTLNPDYPLIRFATGDLSAVLTGSSPCGRTNQRIKGWMGRADQTTKVRGMFVHPSQVADVLRLHPELKRGRLVVERENDLDRMVLHGEAQQPQDTDLAEKVARSIRDVCRLRGEVVLVPPGTLPNDGKIIHDARPVE